MATAGNKHVYLMRSNQLVDGVAKSPSASQLEYGEVAINYLKGYESLFTKNSENEVVNLLSNDKTVASLTDMVTQHEQDYNNPHNVTKEQIGLGNVDNTADIDKPVSTAMQKELDKKLNIYGGIVDNLTTNSTTQALSAYQAIVLSQKIADAQSGSSSETQAVTAKLDAISTRVASVEEEISGAEAIEDEIIAQEELMISDYAA